MTRHDRPEGRPAGVGTHSDDTAEFRLGRGSCVRLHEDAADTSIELLDKAGNAYAHLVYIELSALLEPLRRLRREVTK